MKIKKTIAALLAATTVLSLGALTACGGGTTTVNPGGDNTGSTQSGGMKTYVMEAEYIELENVIGGGISNNNSGLSMIYGDGTDAQKALGWSNGYYVGFTYSPDCVMEFVFNSDKAGTANFVARLGTELAAVTAITPQDVEFSVNGTVLQYGVLSIEGKALDLDNMKFKDCIIGNNVAIKQGENKLVMKIKENKLYNNSRTAGPTIDCIKITTSAAITFVDHVDNLNGEAI